MRRSTLFRRREVWLPTLWGSLALLFVGTSAMVFAARSIHPFLALNQPVGARVLVVEGWMDPEALDQAIDAFRSGGYEHVVTTGGPVEWPGPKGSWPEGTAVTVLARGDEAIVKLSPEEEADLIAALDEADREPGIPAADFFARLRRFG